MKRENRPVYKDTEIYISDVVSSLQFHVKKLQIYAVTYLYFYWYITQV